MSSTNNKQEQPTTRNNFITRSLAGAVFGLVIMTGILINSYTFFAVFLTFTFFGLMEFYGLSLTTKGSPQKIAGVTTGLIIFISSFLVSKGFIPEKFLLLDMVLFILILIMELYRKHETPFLNIGLTFFGIILIAIPFSLLNFIVHIKSGDNYLPYILIGIIFLIWTNDTFAYLSGVTLGKRRLFERVSPKKSWEGSIGGCIATLLMAYLLSIFFTDLRTIDWLVLAGIIVVFGTYGDLVESLLKRSINIKDSGRFLPGHGGILDRFDSLLLSTPIAYLYLIFACSF